MKTSVAEAAAATPTVRRSTIENVERAAKPNRVASILVAVGPGPHSGATVDLARRVAEATDAWLDLFHVATGVSIESGDADGGGTDGTDASRTGDAGAAANRTGTTGVGADSSKASGAEIDRVNSADVTGDETLLEAARARVAGFGRADRFLIEAESVGAAIADQSPYYDLIVVGASTTGAVGRFVFGSTTDTVVDDASAPVVVVESDEATPLR